MGWNSNTGIMTAPLNINPGGDIEKAVHYNSGDLGTCIKNGVINKWAKWKPERNNSIAPLTLAQRQADSFGFNLTKFTDISTLRANFGTQWDYLLPEGLPNGGRFRFYDFLNTTVSSSGYNENAACFFRRSASTFPSTYIIGTGGEYGLRFIAQWEPESQLESTNPGSIKRSEILSDPTNPLSATLANTYFGILMYHPNWSGIKLKTDSSVVGSNTYTSTVMFDDATELQNFPSDVTVYPVFSVESATTVTSTIPRGGLIALPMGSYVLNVLSPSTVVQFVPNLSATYWRARLTLSGSIGIVTTGELSTVSGVTYNVYRATSLSDKTGAQIGVTQSYGYAITEDSPWVLDPYSIMVDRPDYIRVVITGYVSGSTTITSDINIQVTEGQPQI